MELCNSALSPVPAFLPAFDANYCTAKQATSALAKAAEA
jgi:hypothetical protein